MCEELLMSLSEFCQCHCVKRCHVIVWRNVNVVWRKVIMWRAVTVIVQKGHELAMLLCEELSGHCVKRCHVVWRAVMSLCQEELSCHCVKKSYVIVWRNLCHCVNSCHVIVWIAVMSLCEELSCHCMQGCHVTVWRAVMSLCEELSCHCVKSCHVWNHMSLCEELACHCVKSCHVIVCRKMRSWRWRKQMKEWPRRCSRTSCWWTATRGSCGNWTRRSPPSQESWQGEVSLTNSYGGEVSFGGVNLAG